MCTRDAAAPSAATPSVTDARAAQLRRRRRRSEIRRIAHPERGRELRRACRRRAPDRPRRVRRRSRNPTSPPRCRCRARGRRPRRATGRRPSSRRTGRDCPAVAGLRSTTAALVGRPPSGESPPTVSKIVGQPEMLDDRTRVELRLARRDREPASVRRERREHVAHARDRRPCRTSSCRSASGRRRSPTCSRCGADERRQRLVERRPEQRPLGHRVERRDAVLVEARTAARRGCPAPSRRGCRPGRTAPRGCRPLTASGR